MNHYIYSITNTLDAVEVFIDETMYNLLLPILRAGALEANHAGCLTDSVWLMVYSHIPFFTLFNSPLLHRLLNRLIGLWTHSVCFLARHHWHNAKQKRAVLIKRAKRR